MPDDAIDSRQRFSDWDEATRQVLESHQSKMWTALPVIIKKHDTDKGMAHVQPTIKMKRVKPDGTAEWVQMPELQDVPVHYPGGGGATVTMPIKDGDEALILFASRDIDKWSQMGGVQEQQSARMHDISDGFVIPGFRSQPRKLKNISSTTWQLRTDEENPTQVVDFDPTNKKITLKSPNPIEIQADAHITGKLTVDGKVYAEATTKNVQVSTHTHNHGPPPDPNT